ncbi:MAG: DUF1656 domain-containing protein [Acidobacteria bacterium]|nr:DUF1656 domain-containing protein [Acidobacteriota bacterium]MBW4044918.1 DUF1656 domain-containing protein [Acidobacteriota bacterium]
MKQVRARTRNPYALSLLVMPLAALTGCAHSPTFSILGSYFPSWIICIVAAILLTVVSRLLLRRYNLERELGPLPLIYSCLACFFACTIWLLFFY